MNALKYSIILLDADNTVMDFNDAEHQALIKVFADYHLTLTPRIEQIYQTVNQNLWKEFEQNKISKQQLLSSRFALLFEHLGIIGIDSVKFNRQYLLHLGEGNKPMPQAQDVCRRLCEMGCRLYILTNGVSRAQHSRLSSSALAPYLSDIFVSEDAGFQKPRKEYFDYVFARIPHFDSKKALMVGDSLSSDMRGALAAGLDRCWFNPSHQPLPNDLSLTYVISSLTQLLEIVTF